MSGVLNRDGIMVRRGDSFTIKLHFQSENKDMNLNGASIKMSVADENNTKLIRKTGVISDALRGMAAIELTPQDTDIAVGEYHTDIQLELANGQVHTIYPQNVNQLAYFKITAQVTE